MDSGPLDQREAAAWRAAYREGLPPLGEGCPGDEALAALVAGELAGAERALVADHVVACARCPAVVRTLRELHGEARRVEDAWRRRRTLPFAAAAALVIAAGVAFFTQRPVPDEALRSPGGAAAVSPGADALIAAAPTELRWPSQPDASAYRVRLFDATAELVWEAPAVAAPPLELPAELAGRLRSGSSYFWVVEVEGSAARPRLGPYWFHLTAP